MAGSSQLFINHLLPRGAHSAIVCGQTGCGKKVFILSLLGEGPYRGFFRHIVVLCPTIEHNKTCKQCPWLWTDPEVYILDPGERHHDYLRAFYLVFKGEPTLFIIDDCLATVTKPDEPVLYYLQDGPPRGFVREELLLVQPDTQLPPDGFSNAECCCSSLSVALETGQPDVIVDVAHGVVEPVDTELLGVLWLVFP